MSLGEHYAASTHGGIRSIPNAAPLPLIFVATPLGNLRDITLRSLDALREADLIVAEDTRVARRLLSALELPGRELASYREQNAATATAGILERARAQNVVVVSDAGTPGISDPGSELVAQARALGIAIDALPGPSAAIGVALLSGFDLQRFTFEGFPPRSTSARCAAFERALAGGCTTLWYESPKRILATLRAIESVAPTARLFLLREYTKRFEQQLLGNAAAIARQLPDPPRGEIAFALEAAPLKEATPPSAAEIDRAIEAALAAGERVSAIARRLAAAGAGERSDLYARISARKAAVEGRSTD